VGEIGRDAAPASRAFVIACLSRFHLRTLTAILSFLADRTAISLFWTLAVFDYISTHYSL
jgi:hypothetical protein